MSHQAGRADKSRQLFPCPKRQPAITSERQGGNGRALNQAPTAISENLKNSCRTQRKRAPCLCSTRSPVGDLEEPRNNVWFHAKFASLRTITRIRPQSITRTKRFVYGADICLPIAQREPVGCFPDCVSFFKQTVSRYSSGNKPYTATMAQLESKFNARLRGDWTCFPSVSGDRMNVVPSPTSRQPG